MKTKFWLPRNLAACFLFLLTGCGVFGSGANYHDKIMDFASIQTVAVMPMMNLTRDPSVSERVRDSLATRLLATEAFYVLPHGEVMRGVNRAKIETPESPSIEEVIKFGGIVNADAIITGVIREYGELKAGSSAANVISLSLHLQETETGLVIWTAETTKGGVGIFSRLFGGGGQPMDGITRDAVDDLLDKLFAQ